MKDSKSRFESVEVFGGAGGLALGVARAGFYHRVVLETDATACKTLRANKAARLKHAKDLTIVEQDVTAYDLSAHRDKAALVCGGPPCQPFSIAGQRKGG